MSESIIYVIGTSIDEFHYDELISTWAPKLPANYLKKLSKYHFQNDAKRSLFGRVLLYEGLSRYFSINIDLHSLQYSNFNKPFLPDIPVNFNWSHSGDRVECAFSLNHSIGIDIEEMIHLNYVEFKNQMTNNEWDKIQMAINQDIAFYTYWTQKEAVLKANGCGLLNDLSKFEITQSKTMFDSKLYTLYEITIVENYLCNIAIENLSTPTEFLYTTL